MKKAVYKNYKSGKYYTSEGEGNNSVLVTVWVKDVVWSNAESKIDKKGREYKVLECTEFVTTNGHVVYKA